MRTLALTLFFLVSIQSSGQERRILSFDLMSKVVDTLEVPSFDTLQTQESTPFNTGSLNNSYSILDLLPPTENVLESSQFTRKRQASLDYDINDFPIRTTIKLFKWENDSIKSKCSGSMISRKHVLTACHCVAKDKVDSLLYDSLFVCPVVDNGEFNDAFDCSWVKKVFFFQNWNFYDSDFAVLELEKPIGNETGWISIGFDSNDSSLLDGIFYKFSYPAKSIPVLDSNLYNGDTLYYCFGVSDWISEHYFGVDNIFYGIPGESGSSLIKIDNKNNYTSYGVFSFSGNLRHSRLTNWKYNAFKSIIKDGLILNTTELQNEKLVSIYPNPTTDILNVSLSSESAVNRILLFDMNGRKMLEKDILENESQLNLSNLVDGIYILIVDTDEEKFVKKVIKQSR